MRKKKKWLTALCTAICVACGSFGAAAAFAAEDILVYNPNDWNYYRKAVDDTIQLTTDVTEDGLSVSAVGNAEAIGMNYKVPVNFADFGFEIRIDDLITEGTTKQNGFFFGFYSESGKYWGDVGNSVSFMVDLTGKTLPAGDETVTADVTLHYKKGEADTSSGMKQVIIDATHKLNFASTTSGMTLNGTDITNDTNWWGEAQRSFFMENKSYFGIHTWAKDEVAEDGIDDAVAITILSLDGKKIVAPEEPIEPEQPAEPIEYTSTDYAMIHQDGSMEKYQTLFVDEEGLRVDGKNPAGLMATNIAYLNVLNAEDVSSTIKINKAYQGKGLDLNIFYMTLGTEPGKKFDATKSLTARFEFPANFTKLPEGDATLNLNAIITVNSEGRKSNPWEVDEYAVGFVMDSSHTVTFALKDGNLTINGSNANGNEQAKAGIANFVKEAADGCYVNWFSQIGDLSNPASTTDRKGSDLSFTVTDICGSKIVNEIPEAQKITTKPVLSDITANSMKVTWIAAELKGPDEKFAATGYLIRRFKGAGTTPEKTFTVGADTLSYTDTGLEAETRYVYEIVAIYGEGESAIEIAEYSKVNSLTLAAEDPDNGNGGGTGGDDEKEETGGCGGCSSGEASAALLTTLALVGVAIKRRF